MRFREITEQSKPPKMTDAQLQAWAADAAEKNGVPLALMMHVMKTETGHIQNPNSRANAVSPAGAGGVMQIMPGTAKDSGLKNVFDPKQNIDTGAKILGSLLSKYNGNHNSTLAAYNAGQGTVDDYLNGTNKTGKNPKLKTTPQGVPPFKETERYIFGQTDKKGNVIRPAYDPNAQYDLDSIKAAALAKPTSAAAVKTVDPVAIGQAKIDKMPAWDRSKGEPVSPPSQAQARAIDNKIAAAVPAPPTPVVAPKPVAAPVAVTKPEPAPPTPVVAPKPVAAPVAVTKPEPAPPTPVVAPKPVAAPAVEPTGGVGRTGPTIAASKGLEPNNPLNKGSTTPPTPAAVPAPTGDWRALASVNKITNPDIIKPGQELTLPGDIKYTVSKGDTLSGIASGKYKGSAPIAPPTPTQPPDITTDRLKALSGNSSGLPSTAGPLPTIDLLNKSVNDKTSSTDLVPDIKTAQADTDTDDLNKMAVAENSKPINTRRYSFLLGL